MANNATKWPKMIRAVYDSFGTGHHLNDHVARRVMDRIVSWLAAGKALSPRLKDSLIDNINMRTSFCVERPEGEIRLTRDQIQYARKTNPEWFGHDLAADDLPAEWERNGSGMDQSIPLQQPAIPLPFRDLSASITLSFRCLSATFPLEALALAQQLVSQAAQNIGSGATSSLTPDPKVMEWEQKQTNHEPDGAMTFASQPMRLAGSPHDQGTEPQTHEPAALHARTATHEDGHDVGGEEDGPVEIAVSWFQQDDNAPSAKLEVGKTVYSLTFKEPDIAERDLRPISTQDWLDELDAKGGAALREAARKTRDLSRYSMSPFYGARDTRALKAPVEGNAVAIAIWENGVPVAVNLLTGGQITNIPLKPFNSSNIRAPKHKGRVILAAAA
ncbi:hypothetical protein KCP91_12010 [Microvirga sp. SRT01]|uniref:Uncharacterized protein n=1 Tax=Sphingomonas longa TaxID=2778730 RepID=A0ABS2D871_9SPHN|nr:MULTISPECIES: hypothetical protein [Alphaproteobacteria]MBM6577097.1 hypothetical protein [Sphingomonas sp. BT552]MBR7710141.1 hypothetical protein [Microvirga sp. SRT01]